MAGLSALTVAPGVLVRAAMAAAPGRVPRQDTLTTGFNSGGVKPQSVPELTTFAVTLTLEAPTTAFRVALANPTPEPYEIGGIAFCEGSGGAPRPGSAWGHLAVRGAPRWQVAGNTPAPTGATNVPTLTWTDWADLRGAGAGRPQLVLHVLSGQQALPMVAVGEPENVARGVPGTEGRVFAGSAAAGNFVTQPQGPLPDGRRSPFTPIFAVQYRPTTPGVQIIIGGDSQLASWFTFARLAALGLSTPSMPISTWNVATGSQPSRTFWPLLDMALEAQRPSVCVLQGWTANDGLRPEAYQRYLDAVREVVERTRRKGGTTVLIQDIPRDLYERNATEGWREANRALGPAVPDALLFDIGPRMEDPSRPGDWRREFTKDSIHSNLAANEALAGPFGELLRKLL